jgi:hypothetical protein
MFTTGDFDMRWRDIRFEKPTEADGDDCGQVLQLLSDGSVGSYDYANDCDCIAWMPLSELPAFDPIPDPPEGWRFVEAGEAFDKRAKFWNQHKATFLEAGLDFYLDSNIYIVPIDPPKPPEPQYRPFANAAEFAPHRDRWIRTPGQEVTNRVDYYSDRGVNGMSFSVLLEDRTFDDGTPFGFKVEP